MKPETLIYEKIKKIIPEKSEKTVFFAAMSQTIYEVFFYSFIEGNYIQCYELAEQGKLDENELDHVFDAIVDIIKNSKLFIKDKYNIATIKVDKAGIKLDMEYYGKETGIYKIKKEWKQKIITAGCKMKMKQ